MSVSLTPLEFRQECGCTLDDMAEKVGVKSRSYISMIERGAPCSVSVALAYERLSNGRVAAGTLSKDVALVDEARKHTSLNARCGIVSSSGKAQDVSAEAAS